MTATVTAMDCRTWYLITVDPPVETLLGKIDRFELAADPSTGTLDDITAHYPNTILGGETWIPLLGTWREHPGIRAAVIEALSADLRGMRQSAQRRPHS
jgi:hypothetical protein